MPLIQISAVRNTTTWRPCAIYYIGIPVNPSKTCFLGIQRWRLQAASFSSGTGLPRCRNFYLKRKPVPGRRRRRLCNAETRNFYPSQNISVMKSTSMGQSALVAVMGEIINRVTAGKPECTSPLAIITYKEHVC